MSLRKAKLPSLRDKIDTVPKAEKKEEETKDDKPSKGRGIKRIKRK